MQGTAQMPSVGLKTPQTLQLALNAAAHLVRVCLHFELAVQFPPQGDMPALALIELVP